MQTFKEYRQTRDKSVAIINAIAEQLRTVGGEAKATSLESLAQTLDKDDFRIIFCGEFKRGKSTLINALLGQKSLPMKVAPCTGVITEVKYAEEPLIIVHPLEGSPFQGHIDDLQEYISIQGNDAPPVSRVELFFPLDLCQKGITLIDSPGLNEDWRRTQISLTELNKADAVVMVLSCEMALSRSEMDFIEARLLSQTIGSFFVWNRYDAVWNDDQEIAALRERSQSRLEKHEGQVYYLSAREALVSQIRADETRLLRSGLPSFVDSLEQFLTAKRAKIKLLSPLHKAQKAVQYGIHVLIPRAQSLQQTSLVELQHEEISLHPQLQELQEARQELQDIIDESIEDILNDTIEALDQFIAILAQRVCTDSAFVSLPKASNRQERQDFIIRWYHQWLKDALNQLATSSFAPNIRQGLSELQDVLQIERTKFHNQIRSILQIDIDLSSSPLLDAVWDEDVPLFVGTAMALLILGSCEDNISIHMLGLGALRAWLTGQTIDEQEQIKFAQAMADALKSKRAVLIQQMRAHLETHCQSMRNEIDNEMSDLIQDTQKQLDLAISWQEQQQNPQEQIADTLHNLQRLHTVLSELFEDV